MMWKLSAAVLFLPLITINVYSAPNDNSSLGTNLTFIEDYSTEHPFLNLMKTFRLVSPPTFPADANGWPTSVPAGQTISFLILNDMVGMKPPGGTRYTLLYDGEGTLTFPQGVSVLESSPGRRVLNVSETSSLGIWLTATNASNHLRNIRVLPPGGVCSDDPKDFCTENSQCSSGASCQSFESVYETQVFHPLFLKSIERYKVLRFMDWMVTNDSHQVDWANRPHVDDARWSGWGQGLRGVPVEIMVRLCNLLEADMWVNTGHLMTDDYVRQLATYVRDNLHPDLKIYVENSNEIWNAIFPQHVDYRMRGCGANLGNLGSLCLQDEFPNNNIPCEGYQRDPNQPAYAAQGACAEAAVRYHGRRSVEIFSIWANVFGGTDRLVRVLGGAPGAWFNQRSINQIIEDHQNNPGIVGQLLDSLAIAPYFGIPPRVTEIDGIPLAQVPLARLMDYILNVVVPGVTTYMTQNFTLASTYGLSLTAYEGGQGLLANSASLTPLYAAANVHPLMKTAYLNYFENWRNAGGTLFMHFINIAPNADVGAGGFFGSLTHLSQVGEFYGLFPGTSPNPSISPKYDALQEFITTNPQWWTDNSGGRPTNRPPTVNAGTDQTVSGSRTITLNGTVIDDGFPNPPARTTLTWSVLTGPGTVEFSSPSSASADVIFSNPGIYVLRLAASDGLLSASDDLQVTVNDESGNGIGNNQTITETRLVPCSNPKDSWERTRVPVCFDLKTPSEVKVKIYNRPGELVRELTKGPRDAGQHRIDWDLKNDSGDSVRSGTYIAVFEADGVLQNRKLAVIR